jgi:tripeptide aminopeptidase
VRRADDLERQRLGDLFAALCAIASPYGHERACADRVRSELGALGIAVEEDEAGAELGGEAGNLLARVAGTGTESVLLCAHLDTVPHDGPIEPVRDDGVWSNRHETILGADNKAAVAVLLAVARRLRAEPAAAGLELLFTVGEENALAGAKAFDAARLRSPFGYVFDHATPIGEVIVASPTYYRIEAEYHGAAAHAGIKPEAGRSAILAAARAVAAMPLGRLDDETTANVGTIRGGSGVNVVPERCSLVAEARSLDDGKVEETVKRIVDALYDGAGATECDVDVIASKLFQGYRIRGSAPEVAAAEVALRDCGYEPKRIATGGGSDANALRVAGIPVVNLANGTEAPHEPTERVSVAALEGMLDVALALVERAGEALAAGAVAA